MEHSEGLIRMRQAAISRESAQFLGRGNGFARETQLTWEQVVRVLRKQWVFLAVVIGGLILAVGAGALILRNVYAPTARLEIDPLGNGIKTLHEIENPASEADSDYLDTQVQVLQSDGLAMRVIRALRLEHNTEFVSARELANAGRTGEQEHQALPAAGQPSYLQEQLELAAPSAAESIALRIFHRKLYVNPIRSSRMVEVSFAAHDALLAQGITNTLVSQFIEQSYRNRYLTTMEASGWLSTQLEDLRNRVSQSNQAAANYQKKYGLIESDERDIPLAQLMAEVNHQLSDAQANRIQAESFARMVDLGQVESVPAVRDDVVYQGLLTRYTDVRARLAQAQAVYGEENANVKKLQSEAAELTAQLGAERTLLSNRVRSSFNAARDREQMMLDSREKLRAKMGDANSHLVEYRMLKNEAVANATLYNTLEARLREAGIYAGLRSGNIHVVDMAPKLDEATSPHRAMIFGFGTVLSLIVGLACAFVREGFDNTVRIPEDVHNWTRMPFLAVLPTVSGRIQGEHQSLAATIAPGPLARGEEGAHARMLWSEPHSEQADAIRSLRAAVLLSTPSGAAPQVILVSSANAGEGKTTVALNLAAVLAQQGRTCLVEADLRNPAIESALGLHPAVGLVEVLQGRAELPEALIPAGNRLDITVLPVQSLPQNPADLLASEQMGTTLTNLRNLFRYVVIDSPPLIPFSDARSLAQLADAVVLVSRYGSTTRRSITRGAELLFEAQAPVVGVVLNDMDFSSADYHYFNYGYSARFRNHKYNYAKQTPAPPGQPKSDPPPPEMSRGTHA